MYAQARRSLFEQYILLAIDKHDCGIMHHLLEAMHLCPSGRTITKWQPHSLFRIILTNAN